MTAHALFDRNYNPNWPLAGDELAARRTDPASSHEAAKNHFGAKGLAAGVLSVFTRPEYRDRWLSCDDLIRAIFGDGPYDLKTAKRLNKVQTIALKLYRRGVLRRLEPTPGSGEVLRYKLREDIGNIDHEGRGSMTAIEPGRYPLHCSLEWWNEVNDFVRRREVAAALDLPAEAVEIVTDSDEEVDLASVWLVTDGHERPIGHVTFETDGTIAVEILDDDPLATAEDRAARLAVRQALDGLDGDKLREDI